MKTRFLGLLLISAALLLVSSGLAQPTETAAAHPTSIIAQEESAYADFEAGSNHTCALTAGGGVKCWGYNGLGELGDGTTDQRNTPVDVSGLTSGVRALAAGSSHTCALTAGGGGKCWGNNRTGQLGDGATTNRSTPVDVSGLASNVASLAAGGSHTCALVGSGRAKCWGFDGYGQLGIGTITQRLTPVDVVESAPASLAINYAAGQPGSFFTLTGANFPPASPLSITVNGSVLSTELQTSETGSFIIFLDTAAADAGGYVVTASVNPAASVSFTLDASAPLRPQEGGGQTLTVPAGIAVQTHSVYLPLIMR